MEGILQLPLFLVGLGSYIPYSVPLCWPVYFLIPVCEDPGHDRVTDLARSPDDGVSSFCGKEVPHGFSLPTGIVLEPSFEILPLKIPSGNSLGTEDGSVPIPEVGPVKVSSMGIEGIPLSSVSPLIVISEGVEVPSLLDSLLVGKEAGGTRVRIQGVRFKREPSWSRT